MLLKMSKRSPIFLIIAIVFLSSIDTSAFNITRIKELSTTLSLVAPEIGITIFTVPKGKTIFETRSHRPLVPASVAKLLTTYSALRVLGPDYRFRTEFSYSGKIRNNKLQGDIYVKGFGDPFLLDERLWLLAEDFACTGIKEVSGDLIVDGSFFEPLVTRMMIDKKSKRPYNSVISALAVDFNTVTFKILPNRSPGTKALLYLRPDCPYINVTNHIITADADSSFRISIERKTHPGKHEETVFIRGSVPAGAEIRERRCNVQNPLFFSGWAICKQLKQAGIRLSGAVQPGITPTSAKPLFIFYSPPLKDMLYGLNRYSNNFMAEMLFRVMGAEKYGEPGSSEKGIRVISSELNDLGIASQEYHLVNGSGLSHQMLMSPNVIKTILVRAFQDFSFSAEFISSLAEYGKSGTLKSRKIIRSGNRTITRAKTGSLDGVVSLAGYTQDAVGQKLGFVIFCNGVKNASRARKIIDRIVSTLQN